ncbi:MAG: hypothetical protein F6K31_16720 [Symploca sp. SIO2G7]|nr:hypothetical protein [Symploca sp. SIO2G7]
MIIEFRGEFEGLVGKIVAPRFKNQLPTLLDAELKFADNIGVTPLKVGDTGFDDVVNQGTVKWAVTEAGELVFIPKYVGQEELAHTVLTRGQQVLAAGEADIVSSGSNYMKLLEISNHSGHYFPSPDSLDLGIEAFRKQGIDITQATVNKI